MMGFGTRHRLQTAGDEAIEKKAQQIKKLDPGAGIKNRN
jgi:hypothetical protein